MVVDGMSIIQIELMMVLMLIDNGQEWIFVDGMLMVFSGSVFNFYVFFYRKVPTNRLSKNFLFSFRRWMAEMGNLRNALPSLWPSAWARVSPT